MSPPGSQAVSIKSPTSTGFLASLRRTFISEECIAEDDEEVEPRSTSNSRQSLDSHSDTESDARSSSSGANIRGEPSTSVKKSPSGRRGMPMRPLHNVRSSPQLLNQIHEEEGESELDELVPCSVAPPVRIMHRKTVPAADIQRKYERQPRKHITTGQRGGNAGATYSSSDASDTDDAAEHSRSSCNDGKLKFHRRDSSDHSSDTDGPAVPSSHRVFNSSAARRTKNRGVKNGKSEEEQKTQKGKSGGGGHRKHIVALSSLLGKRDSSSGENMHLDAGVKMSNLSITSNLSTGSRANKYIVDPEVTDKDVNALNTENVFQMHVIHVRSKCFTDLVDRFSAGDQDDPDAVVSSVTLLTAKEPTAKVRRRHRDKIKTDINCNGVSSLMNNEVTSDVPQDIRVVSKCCNVV